MVIAWCCLAGCSDDASPPLVSPRLPYPELTVTENTAAFQFRHALGDAIDTFWQERYHEWATAVLGVHPRRIVFNKYISRDHMAQLIGVFDTNAWADPRAFAIHTVWPRDNHEVVHLYSAEWGAPVALFTEGLAVAFQVDPMTADFTPRWTQASVHETVRQLRSEGRWLPVTTLLTTTGFRAAPSQVAYPEAGSFMHWLIATHGLVPIRRLFADIDVSDPADAVRGSFERAFGVSLDAAQSAWVQAIESDIRSHWQSRARVTLTSLGTSANPFRRRVPLAASKTLVATQRSAVPSAISALFSR